jgi:regulator of RNase E activity RraA
VALDESVVVDDATLKMLSEVSTNTLAGLLIKIAGMRTRTIRRARPLNPENARFVGPAYTLRNVPVREDLTDRASMVSPKSPLHGTVDRIPPGSVLVIDMLGDTTCGGLGDVMVAALAVRGVAALVTDGAMRDGEAIAAGSLPVFCNGVNPAPSNRALLAAGVQEMIGCGGVLVVPGDIVVGDSDGVVVVPRHLVAQVAREGHELEEVERWIKSEVEKGGRASDLYPPDETAVARFRAAQQKQSWSDEAGRPARRDDGT